MNAFWGIHTNETDPLLNPIGQNSDGVPVYDASHGCVGFEFVRG